MLKLIVWDETRERALARLARALSEYRVRGVVTNTAFLYNLATSDPFKQAELDTGFIEKHRLKIFHEQDVGYRRRVAPSYRSLSRRPHRFCRQWVKP